MGAPLSAASTSPAAWPEAAGAWDVGDLVEALVERAVDVLDVAAAAALVGDRTGAPRLAAWSNEAVHHLGARELEMGEGPALESWRTGRPVGVDAAEPEGGPWPRFAREAWAAGFSSVQVTPVRCHDIVLGALSLCCDDGRILGRRGLRAARAMADLAAMGMLHHRGADAARVLCEQLQGALSSRVVIEQAKGLVAGRADIDVGSAFGLLRSYARSHNLALNEVCRRVHDGRLPVAALRSPTPDR